MLIKSIITLIRSQNQPIVICETSESLLRSVLKIDILTNNIFAVFLLNISSQRDFFVFFDVEFI